MDKAYEILIYENNGNTPYKTDLTKIRDRLARIRITQRVQRMEQGNFGDHKSLGEGLWELRVDHGQGYRVYYCMDDVRIVLLLCAGDKRTQQKDIDRARAYKTEYEGK